MKRKQIGIRIVFSICAALGWWGLLYPELTMTPDTYEVVSEDALEVQEDLLEWDSEEDIYWRILETESGRIRFKSKLLTQVIELTGQSE